MNTQAWASTNAEAVSAGFAFVRGARVFPGRTLAVALFDDGPADAMVVAVH